jgi:steroid 5-alpha reductase family enzyme
MRIFKDYFAILIAYVGAGAAAIFVVKSADHLNLIFIAAAADFVATVIIFGFSFLFNNSSFYDPYWSVVPPWIAVYWLTSGTSVSNNRFRQAVVMVLVLVWAVRLTLNWAVRWGGIQHEDWRYAAFRERHKRTYWLISFFGIHLMPTVLVFLGCLPLIPALATSKFHFGALDTLATMVTGGAIIIETRADFDVTRFRKNNRNHNLLLKTGIWAYSRHPNYFGEIMFWWGIYLFGLAANPTYWWTIIGPASITLLFIFVSIPMIEKRMLARRPEYGNYTANTSSLFPWPRKKG